MHARQDVGVRRLSDAPAGCPGEGPALIEQLVGVIVAARVLDADAGEQAGIARSRSAPSGSRPATRSSASKSCTSESASVATASKVKRSGLSRRTAGAPPGSASDRTARAPRRSRSGPWPPRPKSASVKPAPGVVLILAVLRLVAAHDLRSESSRSAGAPSDQVPRADLPRRSRRLPARDRCGSARGGTGTRPDRRSSRSA